ncbi:MAG TPA: hypothetical protein VGM77_02495 [Gemmatimonadales bacterium]
MKRALAGLTLVVVVAAGGFLWWGNGAGSVSLRPGTAELAARWYGSTTGKVTLPAQLHWCPVTHVAMLEAVAGDTGIAVVFLERDALASGVHPVLAAAGGTGGPRPAATAALRWLRVRGIDTAVVGLRSEGGTAQLRVVGGVVSGEATVRMRAVLGADTATLHLVFKGVPVVTTASGCT